MKKIIYSIVLVVIAYFVEQKTGIALFDNNAQQTNTSQSTVTQQEKPLSSSKSKNNGAIQSAYYNHQSDVQIQQQGVVVKVLADDLKGSRHQRFILKIDKLSILVAHNIDLAPKIAGLRKGDTVEFYGEYEWNERGGVVHWTHRDPGGRHIHGWLKHKGKTYQ